MWNRIGLAFHRHPFIGSDWRLWLDQYIGMRNWALVLYGALPSSLAALGVVKWPDFPKGNAAHSMELLVLIGSVPLLLTFLLVRQRMAAWYLFPEGVMLRTAVVTGGILLVSTSVSAGASILQGKMQIVPWADYIAMDWHLRLSPVLESLLLGLAFMVGSSTLFLTAVKEDSGLPGLPGKEEVNGLNQLREHFTQIHQFPIWKAKVEVNSIWLDQIKLARDVARKLSLILQGDGSRTRLYDEVDSVLKALNEAIESTSQFAQRWEFFFPFTKSADGDHETEEIRNGVQKLRSIGYFE